MEYILEEINKLKAELNTVKQKQEITENELNSVKEELKEVKIDFNCMKDLLKIYYKPILILSEHNDLYTIKTTTTHMHYNINNYLKKSIEHVKLVISMNGNEYIKCSKFKNDRQLLLLAIKNWTEYNEQRPYQPHKIKQLYDNTSIKIFNDKEILSKFLKYDFDIMYDISTNTDNNDLLNETIQNTIYEHSDYNDNKFTTYGIECVLAKCSKNMIIDKKTLFIYSDYKIKRELYQKYDLMYNIRDVPEWNNENNISYITEFNKNNYIIDYYYLYNEMWKEEGIGHGLAQYFGNPNKIQKI
jgi:hypothetical protein